MPLFTVMLPIVRPPVLLPFAVRSVLSQRVSDFELCIISDGAPRETVAAAEALAATEPRIKVFDRPKGEGRGEAHRDEVLRQSDSGLVAQIADDDLWFPDHLENLARLLATVEFGNLPQPLLQPNARFRVVYGDLREPEVRQRMLAERWNIFGPSFAGYRLATYRALAEGWAPAPAGIPSDLNMWRKFLSHPGIVVGSRVAVTGVHLPAAERKGMSLSERAAENGKIASEAVGEPFRDGISQRVLRTLASSSAADERGGFRC